MYSSNFKILFYNSSSVLLYKPSLYPDPSIYKDFNICLKILMAVDWLAYRELGIKLYIENINAKIRWQGVTLKLKGHSFDIAPTFEFIKFKDDEVTKLFSFTLVMFLLDCYTNA